MRVDHNVLPASSTIAQFNSDQLIVGDELWTAPADGAEVKKGDTWIRVLSVDGVPIGERGWTAIIHKGVPICDNFTTLPEPTLPIADVDLSFASQYPITIKVNGVVVGTYSGAVTLTTKG